MNELAPTARPTQQRRKPDEMRDRAEPSRLAAWRWFAQVSNIGIFLILTVVSLYTARSILMPIVGAIIVGITLAPVVGFAEEYRVPPIVTATGLVALLLGIVVGLASLFAAPVTDSIANGAEWGEAVRAKLQAIQPIVDRLRHIIDLLSEATGRTGPSIAIETSPAAILKTAVDLATPAATEVLLFFATLLFFLAGNSRLRRKIVVSLPGREPRLRALHIWSDLEEHLMSYLGTVTVINAALGLITIVTMFLLGMPNPLAWGLLAFVLNYIPYFGPAIVITLLFAVGLVVLPTLGQALLAPALFATFTTLEGHFITPTIVGRRLTMSPFVAFLALAFWTWLWGPLGAFLAMPLLIVWLVMVTNIFPSDETALPG